MNEASILSRFAIVLWRPKSPGNVGSVARAMKNMGFSRLRIADPIRYRDPSFFTTESERMAWGADDLLAARQEHASIEAAIADASLVVGAASDPPRDRPAPSPRELAPRLVDAALKGTVALLFGQEDIGLTREALGRCQLLTSIPSSASYQSLNLSQAALVLLYEIRLAAMAHGLEADRIRPPTSHPGDSPGGRPTQAEMEGLLTRLVHMLDAVDYFQGSGRSNQIREVRQLLHSTLTSRRQLRIIEGIVRRLSRHHP